ncbi:anthranilate synthase component II [Peribacillus kribbensis]|uniref:anthranilate synthase component II n=1 Tax=Peribacillus kribbensis TaxID=356658 RepID=UPI000423A4BD|nr:aminodeoxychorismate/anthranilate synthase component II [Peribacillus kribbensis]
MILLIDNYDSFTYNLYQYILELGEECRIARNDEITVEEALSLDPESIILSPGPGKPADAGICLELIRRLHQEVPMLGICLGHQAIAEAFGGRAVKARRPMHGKVSLINHDHKTIFRNIEGPFSVTRYHSLIAEKSTLPSCLQISAEAEDGEIMALRHRTSPIEGLQFHPESIMSEHGHELLQTFIHSYKRQVKQ